MLAAPVSVHATVKTGGAEKLHALLAQWNGTQEELIEALNERDDLGSYPPFL